MNRLGYTKVFAPFFAAFWIPIAAFYVGNSADPNIIRQGLFTTSDSVCAVKFVLLDDWTTGKSLQVVNASDVNSFNRNATGAGFTIDFFHLLNINGFYMANSTNCTFPGYNNDQLYFKIKNSYAYIVGGQLIVFDRENFTLSLFGQYMHEIDRLGILTKNNVSIKVPGNSRFFSSEIQGGFQIAYTLNYLVPYIGWYYAHYSAELTKLPYQFDNRPRINFINPTKNGFVLGLTISSHNYFSFNVEARLLAEYAIGSDLCIKF